MYELINGETSWSLKLLEREFKPNTNSRTQDLLPLSHWQNRRNRLYKQQYLVVSAEFLTLCLSCTKWEKTGSKWRSLVFFKQLIMGDEFRQYSVSNIAPHKWLHTDL